MVGEWSCGGSRRGGCPGRDFCSSGTLVVRMTGSSLLVEEEVEGGGRGGSGLLPAWWVVTRGCGWVAVVVRVERLR